MKLMGASVALAGLSGCYWPEDKVLPYSKRPPGRMPGVPVQYATAMEIGGCAEGLLVKSVDGRPIKIEGNPEHPLNRGASSAFAQALVLELYDPDRSQSLRRRESGQELQAGWPDFAAAAATFGTRGGRRTGAGLHVLSEASSSLALADLRARLLKALPEAAWHEYEPVSRDNERAGTALAFGKPYRPQYALDKADVVVAFDSDFLMDHPAAVAHTRQFAARRRADDGTMNRLYVIESALSITGANADHRLALKPTAIAMAAFQLAGLLGQGDAADAPEFLKLAAKDIQAAPGRSLILVGPQQPPAVHALVAALNARLTNDGKTVSYAADADRPSHRDAIRALAEAIDKGEVEALLILGGNPAYNAPAELKFAEKLKNVKTTAHLSLFHDETSRLCNWHLPRAHTLESWGDARAWDGTLSVVQPLIEPLYGGKTPAETLAMVLGETASAQDLVRRALRPQLGEKDFELAWRKAVHDGFVANTACALETPMVRSAVSASASKTGEIEIVFVPDYRVHDGRFANNAWLQELPDPISKLTWDNAAYLSPTTAQSLRVAHGQQLRFETAAGVLEIPAFILDGVADDTLVIPLGYGRSFGGQVADGVGFNAYTIRSAPLSDAKIQPTGAMRTFAATSDHHAISTVAKLEAAKRSEVLAREATLAEYTAHPQVIREKVETPPLKSLFPPPVVYDGRKWGMAIDLAACTGCSACVVACQAENNIPVVGKDEVGRGREMHWLRVDRYVKGDPLSISPFSRGRRMGDNLRVVFQPVPCMHCETAPCEQVCPVAATVHSADGLNEMVYNRCVGTRYCSNNCPYKVRRFNWWNNQLDRTNIDKMVTNPDVTARSRGVMEKCTYCVQRIAQARIRARNANQPLADGDIVPACAQACPAGAIVFGDLNDPNSRVAKLQSSARCYGMLAEMNFRPRTQYLGRLRNPAEGAPHG